MLKDVLNVLAIGQVGVTPVLHETVHSFYVIDEDEYRARKNKEHRDDAQDSDAVKANKNICEPRQYPAATIVTMVTHMRVVEA